MSDSDLLWVDGDTQTSAIECFRPPEQTQQAIGSPVRPDNLPTARIFVRIPNHAFESQTHLLPPMQPRETQNQGEIKSEPIKFELSEGHSAENSSAASLSHKEVSNDTDPNLITARPKNSTKCFKCQQCLYASVFEERLSQHVNTCHAIIVEENVPTFTKTASKKVRKCPACNNEFIAKKSLEVHLELDHEMPVHEIKYLIDDRSSESQQETLVEKPRTNRIFIKSVDVLRQPEVPSSKPAAMQPFATTFPPLDSTDSNSAILMDLINVDSPANKVAGTEIISPSVPNETPPNPLPNPTQSRQKAKIYIKNVDILKEPFFVPPMPAFQSNILGVNDSLNLELFPISNDSAGSLDIYNFNTSTIHSSCSSKENELRETANVESVPKKAANALHLRTVDELNLMNMNEVQNLLAPLPDQNTSTSNEICAVPSSENSKSSDEVLLNNSMPYSISDFPYNQDASFNLSEAEFMSGNWSSCYNFDDLEGTSNVPKIQSDNPPITTHFELNTPQQIVEEENDEDILFVCAQELINDSETFVPLEKQQNEAQLNLDKTQSGLENREIQLGDIVEIEDDLEQQATGNDARVYNEIEIIAAAKDVEKRDALIPEKGRIYVADNLMEDRSDKSMNETYASKRGRGRLFGSRQIGITKLMKTYKNTKAEDFGFHKCDLDCGYRFRDVAKLEYHKRCHTSSHQRMQCPECNQNDFSSWNTLHTHLWRQHNVDMELYSCEFCSFKTPVLSRLMNTHIKIHSDERNFKCMECDKAFKNSKQLKDHRRIHRSANQQRQEAYVCAECPASFGHLKSLKEHVRKKHRDDEGSVNKSQKTGNDGISTRLQCDRCSHSTTDHNALRRHKMTHDSSKQYQCQFCDYSCIQSTLYQKHLQLKHPDQASEVILKCSHCSFATINRKYYDVHIAKHRESIGQDPNARDCEHLDVALEDRFQNHDDQTTMVLTSIFNSNLEDEIYQPGEASEFDSSRQFVNGSSIEILPLDRNEIHYEVDTRHKIKVKSDSVLTDPSKFCTLEPITLPHLEIL